ncbi:MAG: DUF362 domain-containing protein [Candidatus Hodarchaeales archaeon]
MAHLNKLFSPQFNIKKLNQGKLKNNLVFFALLNLFWLIFRTGSKPTRIIYPCQRAAIGNISLSTFVPLSIATPFFRTIKSFLTKNIYVFLPIIIFGMISGELFLGTLAPNPFQEIQLTIESKNASVSPESDIFVLNGQTTDYIKELINLMSSRDLFFYKSSDVGGNWGPEGLIARDDVVLLKINSQWDERGGTNTDLLKELIQAIIDHPDGFLGEIVVADNGQGFGSMDFRKNNAENNTQSTQDVVDMFSSMYNVSAYNWADIRGNSVDEYPEGDMTDGYIVYDTADPETGIYVSYPKFKTECGSYISFKHGLWNGTGYENRLKVINLPVLKSHFIYGVTASLKNYMGVQSETLNGGLANGHASIATGGMGTLMVECGLPTLNIIDAIWVNANPYPDLYCGPPTDYYMATRVNMLIAGIDPVALDFWAAKNVLVPTASSIGYDNTNTLDPEYTGSSSLDETFGIWLDLTKDEILRSNYDVTADEDRMNLITNSTSTSSSSVSSPISGFDFTSTVLSFIAIILLFSQKRRKKS